MKLATPRKSGAHSDWDTDVCVIYQMCRVNFSTKNKMHPRHAPALTKSTIVDVNMKYCQIQLKINCFTVTLIILLNCFGNYRYYRKFTVLSTMTIDSLLSIFQGYIDYRVVSIARCIATSLVSSRHEVTIHT